MIVRAGSGWQTVLADISLILFMVTAAALSQAEEDGKAARRQAAGNVTPLSPHGEPLAVYRAGDGAPPLAQWRALTMATTFAPRCRPPSAISIGTALRPELETTNRTSPAVMG